MPHDSAPASTPVPRHDLHSIYASVSAFFAERSGLGNGAESDDVDRRHGLLRTACVGNPERTIQGELFAYLKARHLNVILEYRLHSFEPAEDEYWEDGRSVDIMVLNDDFLPACAVELKHLGRVQRHIGYLLQGLQADRAKFDGIDLPLIQVGVYTDLETIPDEPREAFEAFRFISCYAFDKDNRPRKRKPGCNATAVTGYDQLISWANDHCGTWYRESFRGIPEQFTTPAGKVSGRVHYFVGVTRDPARAAAATRERRQQTKNRSPLNACHGRA